MIGTFGLECTEKMTDKDVTCFHEDVSFGEDAVGCSFDALFANAFEAVELATFFSAD